jgi:hypothetical protein
LIGEEKQREKPGNEKLSSQRSFFNKRGSNEKKTNYSERHHYKKKNLGKKEEHATSV